MDRSPKASIEKYQAEEFLVTADFSPALLPQDRIVSAEVTSAVVSGNPLNPLGVLAGDPGFTRLTATQKVVSGQPGTVYLISFIVTTFKGETHVFAFDLSVL